MTAFPVELYDAWHEAKAVHPELDDIESTIGRLEFGRLEDVEAWHRPLLVIVNAKPALQPLHPKLFQFCLALHRSVVDEFTDAPEDDES